MIRILYAPMTVTPPSDSSSDKEFQEPLEVQGDQAADTPTAPEGDAPKSLLDVVQSVVKVKDEAPPAEETAQEEETLEAGEQTEEPVEEPKATEGDPAQPEDDSKLPFHKHPRFKEVIRQKNEAQGKVATFEREIEALKPAAERFNAISDYMVQNDLNVDEVNQGFEIMAALKHDPARAIQLLQPHIQYLRQFSGEVLPEDIQRQVDEGEISEPAARRLVQAETQRSFEQHRREQEASRYQQTEQQRYAQANHQAMFHTVSQWEAQTKKSDPDFAAKEAAILKFVRAENALNPPHTPADALANAKSAYDQVNAMFKVARPQTEARPVPSAASRVGAKPEPKSMLEVVQNAARKG